MQELILRLREEAAEYLERFQETGPTTITCYGRRVGPSPGVLPCEDEILWSLSRLPRFGGQGRRDVNNTVLHHATAVGVLMAAVGGSYYQGFRHDDPEFFTGDTPTQYKTRAQSAFERLMMLYFGEDVGRRWSGFDYDLMSSKDYKPADCAVLDAEAMLWMGVEREIHEEQFAYDVERWGIEYNIQVIHDLYADILRIDAEELFHRHLICHRKMDVRFRKDGWNGSVANDIAHLTVIRHFELDRYSAEELVIS